MKIAKSPNYNQFLTFVLLCFSLISYSQIGIGTTTPRGAVDIASTTQGFVLPTVSLAATNIQTAINPQGGAIPAGTIVYNDSTSGTGATAVSPGMYYWDSAAWISVTQSSSNDWSILGNAGTNASTNFIGTTDAAALTLRTNNTERFRIPNAEQVHALSRGTQALPFYSWEEDTNTGMWLIQGDELGFSAGNIDFLRFRERGQDEAVFNINGNDVDFRVETDNEANMFFIDGGDNQIGIKTNNPQNDIHIAGNTTGIRIDAFSSTNHLDNNGVDEAVIYVDSNGDLLIKPSLTQNQMPEDNATTFSPASIIIDSPYGAFVSSTLYSTTFTITQNALVEVVYQIGVNLAYSGGGIIEDGLPRQYGTAVLINGTIVGYTSEAFTSNPDSAGSVVLSGTYFLNGNGYAQLTGAAAGTTYTIDVVGFVSGGDDNSFFPDGVEGEFGGNTGLDRFQIITHY